MSDRLIVVGGGLGGLSAAIRLAAAGKQVTLLERTDRVGGKMREVREAGYRWDTGPSLITLKHVLHDLFAEAGRRLEDYVELAPIDPLTRYHYADGSVLDIWRSITRTTDQIAALEPRDVDGYLRFLACAARLFRITAPVAIYGDGLTLRSAASLPVRDLVHVDGVRTMAGAIRAHVRSPYLRQMLGRFATYLGASPYRARAVLNVISHVELTAGLSYVRGGLYQIARAYLALAQELGVEVRTGTPVTQVRVKEGRAVGVTLDGGIQIDGRAVIVNADALAASRELLSGEMRAPRRWERMPLSCSGFVMLLGIEGAHPQLAHHNIFFSTDYRAEFDAIFEQGLPPAEPTVYVAITSKSDPDHAPPGCENWFVMANVPPIGPGWDWQTQAEAYRDRVLARLAAFGLDVRERIRVQRLLTPLHLAHTTGAWRGALYGHSFNPLLAPFLRPRCRAPGVQGLYFCGGTTHPGGGVPMVTLSGGVAARAALQDLRG